MKTRSTPQKHSLFVLLLMLAVQAIGCVSIRNTPPTDVPLVANCGLHAMADPGDCCELHDRRVVLQQCANQLNPIKLVPSGVSDWSSQQYGRCSAANASVQGWIHEKKEAANAPPWPRFHPVPTKPVFESEGAESSAVPETYGRFGKL